MTAKTVETTPFTDQKPGTSGLRKKVVVFQQLHYTENFIQATFDAVTQLEGSIKGSTLVVGGDGRYFVKAALQTIIQMAHANNVGKLIIGTNGLFSTPAVSAVIRKHKAKGGIILTASHNPGGPKEDFGIKYNIGSGGPAPSNVTDLIFTKSKEISKYYISELETVDLSKPGVHTFDHLTVEVVDSADDYVELLKTIFDFDLIKSYISSSKLKMRIDCLNGVAGPYAKRIFVKELGADSSAVVHDTPLPNFGGGHPDPNLVYAADLVNEMQSGKYDFGAAFDGDADRNMVLGKNAFFVTPSDSVAVIAAHAKNCIPYFKNGLKGVARSMPSSAALDHVAKDLGVEFNEVPTGWKFFGNLMDAGRLSVCGEESFGTGSDHVREKDGVWAILCWLSILASTKQSVEEVLVAHWTKYGRNYFTRYDYEGVESEKGAEVMEHVRKAVADPSSLIGSKYDNGLEISDVNEFSYTDPVDKSVSKNQGVRFVFTDGSRIIFRLSGTGSSGATIRMYIDSYVKDADSINRDTQVALKSLVEVAMKVSRLKEITLRSEPTVIT